MMIVKCFIGPFLIDVAHQIWVKKPTSKKINHFFIRSGIGKVTI